MHNYSARGPGPYAGRTLTYWLWFATVALLVLAAFIVIADHQSYPWLPDGLTDMLTEAGLDGTL
jgi:hypothetical protein